MSNLKKDLLLVEVVENTGEGYDFRFLSEDEGLLYEVRWNLREYDADTKKWNASEAQQEKVAKWAEEYFETTPDKLTTLGDRGVRKDIYHYDKFNSLWEVKRTEKMPTNRVGEIFPVEITEVEKTDKGFQPKFEEDGNTYAIGGFSTSTFLDSQKKFFQDPVKTERAKGKFEDKFGIPVEHMNALVGEEVMVEVKSAFGEHTWLEAKKFNEAKQKQMKEKAGI